MTELLNSIRIGELLVAPEEVVETYFNARVLDLKSKIQEQEDSGELIDPTERSLAELMELAVGCKQYARPRGDYDETTKVLKIRINLPRKLIEQYFEIETVSMYGVGLYAPVEGLMLSSSVRRRSDYDNAREGKKHSYFDISFIPEELKEVYDFRIAIPAMEGLFVPKKSKMTEWIGRTSQIQFFDLMT